MQPSEDYLQNFSLTTNRKKKINRYKFRLKTKFKIQTKCRIQLLSSVTCSNTLLPAILPSSLPNFKPCLQPILDTKTRRHSLGTFRTVNLVFLFFNKCSVSHYKPLRLFFFQPVGQSLSNYVRQSSKSYPTGNKRKIKCKLHTCSFLPNYLKKFLKNVTIPVT
jgi:hypothetical protein